MASELGNGFERAHASEHGNGEKIEQSGQGILFAAWVGESSEQFGKGQRTIHAKGLRRKKKSENLITETCQPAQIKSVNNPAFRPLTLDESIRTAYLSDYRALSSVGLEHQLDKLGVTGSSPVAPIEGAG